MNNTKNKMKKGTPIITFYDHHDDKDNKNKTPTKMRDYDNNNICQQATGCTQ